MRKYSLFNHVAFYRKSKHLTQTQLADLVGVSKNTISAIETGVFCPTAYLAYKLCYALDVTFENLFFMQVKEVI